MHNFPSTEWPPTTGLGWDSVYVSLALQWPLQGDLHVFPWALCTGMLLGRCLVGRWKSGGWCDPPQIFIGKCLFLGGLRSCTTCELLSKHFDTFFVFSSHESERCFTTSEKQVVCFSCFNYGKPGWNDAAETHAATHGYFSRQYPIIFYFWVVQGICHMSYVIFW